jgi:hypothetical protein
MLILGIVFAAFGMALLIKSDLGQSTISGISNNIGIIANMKTGTVLAIINYICFGGQIIYALVFGPLTNIFIKSLKELKLKIYKKCIN